MVHATCLYNGCLPCTDENNLVNQHQSGFLVQFSNHKGQTVTDRHKPSSTDTTLALHAWYSSLPSDHHEEMQYEYPFPNTYPLKSSKVPYSELYTKFCTLPSSPAVTQTNSGIRKTTSRGMWPKSVLPANTLQFISLNTAAGSFKALMTKAPAGDFYPLLGQLLRNESNHTLSCSSVSSRLCTGTLQTSHIELCAMTLLMH